MNFEKMLAKRIGKEGVSELFNETSEDFKKLIKRLNLGEKQKLVLNLGEATHTLLSGAKRSGKTYSAVLRVLLYITEFKEYTKKHGGGAVFLVTGKTVVHARRVFLNTVNVIMEQLGLSYRYNAESASNSEKWQGVAMYFFGLGQRDAYDSIQGITAFGWYGTEITKSLPDMLTLCQDRVSYWQRLILWDCNPEHPMHSVYINYVQPNIGVELGARLHIGCLHFNYLDSVVHKDYWDSQKIKNQWSNLNEQEEHLLLKDCIVDESEKEVINLIRTHKIKDSELRDKYGKWMASDDMPLRNIQTKPYDVNAIKYARTVAFLDVANTANEKSCYSALAIAWRVEMPTSHDILMFTGTVWKEPIVDVIDEIGNVLNHFQVSKFYYEENGAGALLGQMPNFRRFGGIGFTQKRNKVSRILGDSLLDRMCSLGILVEQKLVFAHNDCDIEFLRQVRNFKYVESPCQGMGHKVIGYCDAPDALASALYMLEYGEREHK